jgi:hypothetical protein
MRASKKSQEEEKKEMSSAGTSVRTKITPDVRRARTLSSACIFLDFLDHILRYDVKSDLANKSSSIRPAIIKEKLMSIRKYGNNRQPHQSILSNSNKFNLIFTKRRWLSFCHSVRRRMKMIHGPYSGIYLWRTRELSKPISDSSCIPRNRDGAYSTVERYLIQVWSRL